MTYMEAVLQNSKVKDGLLVTITGYKVVDGKIMTSSEMKANGRKRRDSGYVVICFKQGNYANVVMYLKRETKTREIKQKGDETYMVCSVPVLIRALEQGMVKIKNIEDLRTYGESYMKESNGTISEVTEQDVALVAEEVKRLSQGKRLKDLQTMQDYKEKVAEQVSAISDLVTELMQARSENEKLKQENAELRKQIVNKK